MVRPRRVGDQDERGLFLRSECAQERKTEAERARATEALHSDDALLGEGGGFLAEEEAGGEAGEIGQAALGEILVVVRGAVGAEGLLDAAHDGQDVGLILLGAVGADAEVHFRGRWIGFEGGI